MPLHHERSGAGRDEISHTLLVKSFFRSAQATTCMTTSVQEESQSEIAILYRQRRTQPVISSVYCKRNDHHERWCGMGDAIDERTISAHIGRRGKLEHSRNDPPLGDEGAIQRSAHVQKLQSAKAKARSKSFQTDV